MGVLQQQQQQPHFFNGGAPTEGNNNVCDVGADDIRRFYEGANVFLTGATGFVGKALVEKLLRSCAGVGTVYVLVRPKRGMSAEQRVQELGRNPVFERVRAKDPGALAKVVAVPGDVSLPGLGLSDTDRRTLAEAVHVVFHSAATVKFNEDLGNAVVLNTLGTRRVLELCDHLHHLRSFVHVSTAYSHADRTTVEETVYKPAFDPNAVINCVEILPPESLNALSKRLVGNHPNTYTFTKAMAEHLVLESSSTIPAAVVRPSIITAAWKEPFPGWVDNISGITGIFMECGRGTIKSIICDEKCIMDLIPVDVVVNTIITSAWHTAAYRSNTMRIYNCTSGSINPLTWKRFGQLTQKYSIEYPSKYVTWYPGFTYRTNRLMHFIYASVFQLAPAGLLDVFLYCTRQKPMMLRIGWKFYNALIEGKFFATNEWNFHTENMHALLEAVRAAKGGDAFDIDMRPENGFEWETYIKDFTLGVRQYILKDDISSLESAKVKLNRLFWFQKACQALTIYAVFKMFIR